MGKIRILPDNVANKIAAGEVVERPASVAKELAENALDAGAASIRIEVEAGGKKLIRITDDGCGMGRDDALLAFERHATSKLRSADDLMSVATLGFRGEALPSIAAVSRLTLETRAAEEPSGTRVEINGGRLADVREAGLPVGTCVTVRDLFYNIPARRKFLKSEATELAHIASFATHYALAHPERQLALYTSTGELLNVSPVATHRERLFQIFGGETLDQLVELGDIETALMIPGATSAPPPGFTPEHPAAGSEAERQPVTKTLRLSGFISRPQFQKTNRNSIFIFVNRRLVRDRIVLHAISEAYRNLIPPACYPLALLFLEMPFDEVDVNVHPSKVEVRFRHQSFVHDFVRDALRRRLSESRPVSTFPVAAPPVLEPQPVFPQPHRGGAENAEKSAPPLELRPPRLEPESRRFPFGAAPPIEAPRSAGVPNPQAATCPGEAGSRKSQADSEPAPAGEGLELASLRPLGQLKESFIVAASEDALWIVDQHVAHERVLFEKTLRDRAAGHSQRQRLLMPLVIQLAPAQDAALEEIRVELEANGFEIEPFGRRTIAVKAAPSGIAAAEIEKMLQELLDGIDATHVSPLANARSRVAASIACHAAIKVNTPLDPVKMRWLLDELARTEAPMSCPHGRPVILRYELREILKAFHRI
jgi:DNA mismatch repair protein MutL